MSQTSENIRQELIRLVPAAFMHDIVCFVFYDNHPMDKRNIDIIICTINGEMKEIYEREVISSTFLDVLNVPIEVKIMRNVKCDLFYLVLTINEVIILSKTDTPAINHRITKAYNYIIDPRARLGQPYLTVNRKDNEDPVTFDENLENLEERAAVLKHIHTDDVLPIVIHLKRKLREAKYNVYYSENTYKNLLELHQLSAYSIYEEIHPNEDDSIFNKNFKEAAGALKIITESPWVKLCNNKIVIIFSLIVNTDIIIEDVKLLLHGSTQQSLTYTTKLFYDLPTAPFWKEKDKNTLEKGQETAVVTVIDMKEINYNRLNRIHFSGVISCVKQGRDLLIPIENISLSALTLMNEKSDLLTGDFDDLHKILAILATTENTELCVRLIDNNFDPELTLSDLFCVHMNMERIPSTDNLIIHRVSPYHILYGVMILIKDESINSKRIYSASVYSRTPSQVVSLLHYIYDAIPCKIVISSTNYKIISKMKYLTNFTEEMPIIVFPNINYQEYASSILKRTHMILEYLDSCIVEMNKNQDTEIQSKEGNIIDLYAGGLASFLDFKNMMIDEAMKCNNMLKPKDLIPATVCLDLSKSMVTDEATRCDKAKPKDITAAPVSLNLPSTSRAGLSSNH